MGSHGDPCSGLFNIFINDLKKGVPRETSNFSNNTKLFWVVRFPVEGENLQKYCMKLSGHKSGR